MQAQTPVVSQDTAGWERAWLELPWKPQGKDKRGGKDKKMYLRSTSSNV